MKSLLSKKFVSTFVLITLFFFTNVLHAQQFTATSYLNNFTGTIVDGGGQSWNASGAWGSNTVAYSQNNELKITFNQSAWIYAENVFNNAPFAKSLIVLLDEVVASIVFEIALFTA